MANGCVLFFTDNAALVDIINKRTSKTLTGHDSYYLTLYSATTGGGGIYHIFLRASLEKRRVLPLPFTDWGIQGTLAGGGQFSNSSANEPTAEKLVTHLRDLLLGSGYLVTASRSPYLRVWLGTNPSIPRWPPLSPISRPKTCHFYDCEAAMPSVLCCPSLPRRLS